MPSFSDLPGSEGFLFRGEVTGLRREITRARSRLRRLTGPALVSQRLTRAPICIRAQEKDQRMFKVNLPVLALAGVLVPLASFAQYAAEVISYSPGVGFSRGYTNATSALGEPSRVTPGVFGGPVDPFDPDYLPSQLVSIGAGGSLTVKFSRPVLNHPNNRFGIDFIIFGDSGFIITNAFDPVTFDLIGIAATDGSLFGNNTGVSRVWVSRDGVTFYELNPALAPTVDNLLPTDGSGNFSTPADPTLTQTDFAGLSLEQIRALYLGSAGGAGYDISWAQDAEGNPANLQQISYVRVEILSGKAEVDGFAAVFTPRGLGR